MAELWVMNLEFDSQVGIKLVGEFPRKASLYAIVRVNQLDIG